MYHSVLKIRIKHGYLCLDMEGTLTPEIWEQVSIDTGISEFNKTTRDIPSYTELMDHRIEIMKKYDLKLADIIDAAKKVRLAGWST